MSESNNDAETLLEQTCAFMIAEASLSVDARCRKNASISSMNITHGSSLRARLNKASTSFCDSPYHLSISVDTCRLMKTQPD